MRVGPPLWGVEGRQVASVGGFSYSGGLRNRGGTWDDASLDAFLKNPRGYAPGNGSLTRDYYRVEDNEGRRFWLFRRGLYDEIERPLWYLHGIFA